MDTTMESRGSNEEQNQSIDMRVSVRFAFEPPALLVPWRDGSPGRVGFSASSTPASAASMCVLRRNGRIGLEPLKS